jgi:hypothetical protein
MERAKKGLVFGQRTRDVFGYKKEGIWLDKTEGNGEKDKVKGEMRQWDPSRWRFVFEV